MKYLLKIFIFSTLIICATQIRAQVTGVQYAIQYNPNTNLFDCFIYIKEGRANSIRERVQFNAQYSLVIPTGANVEIADTDMPLIDNQKFNGIQPMSWTISSKLISPKISPGFDLYGVTPNLAPAGFYNKLKEGDLIRLFSVSIEGENVNYDQVRLYDNDTDPKSHELGMQNGDFSNGFTMGSYNQIYKGIKIIDQEEGNYTSIGNEK